ncbi:DMT family transporter [Xanthomonas translucens pv. phlei]|uniref:EamA domain-containing protein n=1 Tax=Xanthomonas graminis pv. phlei TaxID=487906 RepID=A0A0K2ZF93_9XANT|nr:DMT family transporter [Xanthomonas translucens]UKE66994.1 DMT family transporter [Xanthomonas translucens pv. phlei]CTP84273.1 hypothetical protein XTPLMG730_0731 [Xanthomonas translucens pv. phlei]
MNAANPTSGDPAEVLPAPALRDWRTPLELLFLGIVWGCSFLFMRLAAPQFGGYALVELRLALGATVLLPFLWMARARFPLRRWPALAWACAGAGALGVVCTVLAFLMYYRLIQRIGPARASTVTYLVPVFGALLSWSILGEPLT